MKVQWTDNAIAHLVNIYEYIALNSPIYAKQMVDKITFSHPSAFPLPHSIASQLLSVFLAF
jgi:plasmid stabilization system protein ParE